MSCSYCKLGAKIPCLNDESFSFRISRDDHSLKAIAPNGTVKEVHANYCIVCGEKIVHETTSSIVEGDKSKFEQTTNEDTENE